ncbi:GNAT family N-acetyltransferase [Thermithiobacillus plumbiphilus]|uniref:GNAT family N-acetyltransferase n=1 Tax=Thermithiobacillus plumbiphilus TaxID=1729899 RepID=UPI003BF964F6
MGQYPIPLVILARLAVDLDYQVQGLGSSLLQDAIRRTMAIAEQGGIQALLRHPIDAEAEACYRRFGFEPTLMPCWAHGLLLPTVGNSRHHRVNILGSRTNPGLPARPADCSSAPARPLHA